MTTKTLSTLIKAALALADPALSMETRKKNLLAAARAAFPSHFMNAALWDHLGGDE